MTDNFPTPVSTEDESVDRRGLLLMALGGGLARASDELRGVGVRVRRGAAAMKPQAEGHDPCLSPRGPRRFTAIEGRKR